MSNTTQLAAALAAALASKPVKGKKKKAKLTDDQKAANATANAQAAEKIFSDAGYKDCQAHVTIKTYDKWVESGRRVRKGEKALRAPNGPALFHLAQTDEIVKSN